jgi:hypothetical protein
MDHGKALSMVREKCATAFWRTIYAKGSNLIAYKDPASARFVYGARACDFLKGDMNIKELELNYSLTCAALREQGLLIDPSRLQHMIRSVGKAEAVPPWTREQWGSLLDKFLPCQIYPENNKTDVETDDETDDESVRFVFTHQMFDKEKVDTETYQAMCSHIHTCLQNDEKFQALTDKYQAIHEEWKENHEKISILKAPDFPAATKSLCSLGKFVSVVKTYVCMQSVVTVCKVKKCHIKNLHEKLMGWVSVLAQAHQIRVETEMNALKK